MTICVKIALETFTAQGGGTCGNVKLLSDWHHDLVNDMTLLQLSYFCVLARLLNFHEAAEELHISQPTLSHHMRILCGAGIVKCRKDGKWMHYSLDPAGARHAEEALRHILTIEGDGQDCCKS